MSVLTPVLNEAGMLERTLPTMLGQRLEEGEIEFIFAEGNSQDGTREMLERVAATDARVNVIENPSGHTPDALNLALARARGEYVARMDAHTFYPVNYLADGIARLEEGGAEWVAGPCVPRAHGGFSGAIALALCLPLGRGPSERRPEAGAEARSERELRTSVFLGVWRRSTLLRHGGWDPRWLRAQDTELAARFLAAGDRIVLLPSMSAELMTRQTLRAFWRQYHRSGRYRAYTLMRHRVARERAHSLALAPGLVAAIPAAASRRRIAQLPARVAIGAYAGAVAVETAHAMHAAGWRKRIGASWRDVARLPLAFGAMHVGFGAGMWRGLAEGWIARAAENGRATLDVPRGADHSHLIPSSPPLAPALAPPAPGLIAAEPPAERALQPARPPVWSAPSVRRLRPVRNSAR